MKTQNLPGFLAESSIPHSILVYSNTMTTDNNFNNIVPQGRISDALRWAGGKLKSSILGWAVSNSAYAGCWWACVADNGIGEAVECSQTCDVLRP